MDYKAHYTRLMDRSKGRVLDGYTETHHIQPRCLGGSDELDNLAVLTAEEHYVAHLLLVKMYPEHKGLLFAAIAMTGGNAHQGRSNKIYGWLRKRWAEKLRGREVSSETREKLSIAKRGNAIRSGQSHTAETKAKMSQTAKGRVFSPEHKEALRLAKLGKKRGPHSATHKARLSTSIKAALKMADCSFNQSPEYKALQAEKMRQIWESRRQGLTPMPNYQNL